MENSISVERTCISVSDNYEAESKACIKVSSNAGTCPTVQGWITYIDANLEVPILQKMEDFNCTTYTYLISNFQNKANYYTKMNAGDITYLSDGEMLYKPPRVNVPTEDLVLCVWASYGSNTTVEVCVKPEKLPVTPKPILGTPSEQYAYNDADITIPITNYLVGESIYTPVSVDNGYATIVDGVLTWSFDLNVEYGKIYNLVFRGYNDCHSESELCTFEMSASRYTYLNDLPIEDGSTCPPLCAEGWYFDCETETCKEYRSYIAILNDRKEFILKAKSTYPGVVDYNGETPWWYANGESLFGLANNQSTGLQPMSTIQDFSPYWKQINSVTISSLVPMNSSYDHLANPSNAEASPYFIKTFIKVSTFYYTNFEAPDLGYLMDDYTYLQVYSWKIVDTFSLYGVK